MPELSAFWMMVVHNRLHIWFKKFLQTSIKKNIIFGVYKGTDQIHFLLTLHDLSEKMMKLERAQDVFPWSFYVCWQYKNYSSLPWSCQFILNEKRRSNSQRRWNLHLESPGTTRVFHISERCPGNGEGKIKIVMCYAELGDGNSEIYYNHVI